MYYLSVVEIFMKETTIDGVFFAGIKYLEKIHLNEIVRHFLVADGSLMHFKYLINNDTRDHLFSLLAGRPYEVSIYQFDTLSEIDKILADVPNYWEEPIGMQKELKIPAPKVAFAQSVIPEDISNFKIEWK